MNTDMSFLDFPEALLFYECNPPVPGSKLYFVADLSAYKQATPEALEYLALKTRDSCDFVNVGLISLDKEQAGALAGWEGTLCFLNLERLNAGVAAILAEGGQILAFENLGSISADVACELAKLNAILDLRLDSISLEIAHALIRHPHELDLQLKDPPSEELMTVLSGHAGYRLQVTWERQDGIAPCIFSPSSTKKVFIAPRFHKESGKWFENVCIWAAEFYPDVCAHHAD